MELIDLLENGARLLLEKQQMESGSDLAIILIDVLIKSKIEITEEWISKVTKLFSLMNPSMPERETYVANATRWSMGTKTSGHPSFHSVRLSYQLLRSKDEISDYSYYEIRLAGESWHTIWVICMLHAICKCCAKCSFGFSSFMLLCAY